jgi:transposase, IS5 family
MVGFVRRWIEKIFGTWKRSYGLRLMRWRGLAKAALQVRLTATAYNLRRHGARQTASGVS